MGITIGRRALRARRPNNKDNNNRSPTASRRRPNNYNNKDKNNRTPSDFVAGVLIIIRAKTIGRFAEQSALIIIRAKTIGRFA